ncbi:histone deacetylase [Desulfatiglans anilini]|uniref:histone deacetylase n=1 Tax=Desulfatiglans anilini TaxID=90728 RepID=UPI0013780B2B|nr:histone deacetylase [Desulfatiglans anilini]
MPTTILASDALKILERFLCAYQRNAKLEGLSLKVAIVYHEDFKKYSFGPNHPLIGDYMDGDIAFKLVKENEKISTIAEIDFFKPNEARDEDILAVHTKEYIDFVLRLNENGGMLTLDTPVLKGVYDVARLFAGADILGGKLVLDESCDKSFVFSTMGHHVGADFGGGFGILNDVAIMIEVLRIKYGLSRVLVIDYAANTGHGTQKIFYDTPEVLCIDIHQDPLTLYPGIGFPEQVGKGKGKGYTVNVPIAPYSSDADFIYALKEIVLPIGVEYKPELVVAVGLNGAHFTVQINQLMLTLNGLNSTVCLLSEIASRTCKGKFVHVGGFSLDQNLSPLGFLATVAGGLNVDIDFPEPYDMPQNLPDVSEQNRESIARIRNIHKKYWKCLN